MNQEKSSQDIAAASVAETSVQKPTDQLLAVTTPSTQEAAEPKANKDYSYTQNRELSWLNFNRRCLEEALDKTVPLFEKLTFIKIFCTNLDEFCMVRVGKLSDLAFLGYTEPDNKSGHTPAEQLTAIFERLPELYREKDKIFKKVEVAFRKEGIYNLEYSELNGTQSQAVYKHFRENIFPLLSPLFIDGRIPFPFLENLTEYILLKLERKGKIHYGIVTLPPFLPKIIKLPTANGYPFIRTSKVIYQFVEECYPNSTVLNKTIVRVTRNADLTADDEINYEDEDYRTLMQQVLVKRRRLQTVRVEVNEKDREAFTDILCRQLNIQSRQIIQSEAPLSMDYVSELKKYLSKDVLDRHTYPPYHPRGDKRLGFTGDLLNQVQARDYFFSYPYDSMDAFISLLDQAAVDDRVVSIKITIYRLAENSSIAAALCRAAENGKEVLVLMELRARFDEQNNLDYSQRLYDSGCQIIYGMAGYKVHSKVCLITLKDDRGWSFISQFGTGNYNEQTARGYCDFALITANQELGEDTVKFFRNLTTSNLYGQYQHLLQSPSTLKSSLLKLMDREIAKGEQGYIFFKMNSLTDRDFIDKLQVASQAGVEVKLLIRGICCLIPNLPGKTENIQIHSLVGRYLEHARVYLLGRENPDIYIGSADLMTRNTEHRVEVLCPVYDPQIRQRIQDYLAIQFRDQVKGRYIGPDGDMHKIKTGDEPFNAQDYLMQEASSRQIPAALDAKEDLDVAGFPLLRKLKAWFKKWQVNR